MPIPRESLKQDPVPLAIPSRRILLAAVAAVVVTIGCAGAWFVARGGSDSGQPMIGGAFTLTDGRGRTVTEHDLLGRFALIYFGYTYCPDVCPTTLNAVAGALDKLGAKADRVRPVFISIDPKRDTPAVVATYVAAFSPRLMGLTGTPAQVAEAARAYRVYYAPHKTGPGPVDYTMDHSSILYLMGPDGSFVAPIRADQPAADMAADVGRYLG